VALQNKLGSLSNITLLSFAKLIAPGSKFILCIIIIIIKEWARFHWSSNKQFQCYQKSRHCSLEKEVMFVQGRAARLILKFWSYAALPFCLSHHFVFIVSWNFVHISMNIRIALSCLLHETCISPQPFTFENSFLIQTRTTND